ncbi:MAG: adenylosuccinate synthase [Clostridia bacterium]|nr:adenylosuccinate synthase [Clostridia bacterium]
MLTAVVGINWGDEGKGRMVDLLSEKNEIVVRYQGGNNAGHTVINEKGKFVLNLLPSGILRDGVVNVMGNGMVIDMKHLVGEIDKLREGGISVSPANLKISDKAIICMPYHVRLDCLEEERLADKKYGSTRRGISPVYGDKYMKKGIRMADLFESDDVLRAQVTDLLEYKNLIIDGVYHSSTETVDDMMDWLRTYGDILKPYICDVCEYLDNAAEHGMNIMFEAQLGALRDIDFGIYPFTSSSNVISAYAPIGSGIPGRKIDYTLGIMKAYSTCVGEGPFTCEMFGDEADKLRQIAGEYGAATGRPRRVGPFDVPASKYGVKVQGADDLALTKLDILSYMDKIPVCVAYDVDGERTTVFPTGDKLNRAKPIIEYLDGWKTDIGKCRKMSDLPENAVKYIEYIEKAVCCNIRYISVGAQRDEYIEK